MAKLTGSFVGDHNYRYLVDTVTRGILDASATASLEESWDTDTGTVRCSVRVFERYSYTGGNRVSMSLTFLQTGDTIQYCAITSGGSQAVFMKLNTWGEEAFLDTFRDVLASLK